MDGLKYECENRRQRLTYNGPKSRDILYISLKLPSSNAMLH